MNILDRGFEKNITLRYTIRTSIIVHVVAIVACMVGGVLGMPVLCIGAGAVALLA